VITIDSFVIGDEPGAWLTGGFAVDGAVTWFGEVRIEFAGRDGGRGIRSWTLRGATGDSSDDSIDGLPTAWADGDVGAAVASAGHSNGTVAIDHVVVLTPNYPRTIAALGAAGFVLRRERDIGNDAAPRRQGFFKAGEVIIEVAGAADPDGVGPAAFFGLALTVTDLDATAMLLGDSLGNIKDAVQPGRRIATLRHRNLHMSTAIAFMSGDPSELA
jgi:hypothetical protein